jgi:membrane protein implicated in regulation of membrane protease activity
VSDDFLRLFAFRTGLPCGYLLFFLFGVFCCVVAVVVLVVGIVWRKVVLVALPSLFLLLAATFVVGNIAYERSLDINASLPNAELIGRWQTPQSTLVLRRDGSYQLRAGDDLSKVFATSASVGKWQPEGFGVRLTDSSGRALPRLRTITFRGKPHLILEFDDPDAWDGDLGFSKAPGA